MLLIVIFDALRKGHVSARFSVWRNASARRGSPRGRLAALPDFAVQSVRFVMMGLAGSRSIIIGEDPLGLPAFGGQVARGG